VSLRARSLRFRLLGALFEHLPERFDVWATTAIFGAIGSRSSWRSSPLADNVALALAGGTGLDADPAVLGRYVRRSMRTYGRYWAEGAKLPAIDRTAVSGRLRVVEGERHLREAAARGGGVILALPHVGSWEWGGAFLADFDWPMLAVVERLEPPSLYDWFVAKREAMGLRVVPLDDGASGQVAKALRAGAVVGLLCDRDLQNNGIAAELFGCPTTVPAGPAMLAMRTGATLLCAAVYSGPGRDHHVVITPPLATDRRGSLRDDVTRVTQAVTDELGWLIRRAPEQWHVLQPIGAPE
jgi:phosphatidylinositol dimannoside acyltransferase